MSDPVTNAEVEDVLSSIRRLVSEDRRPQQTAKSEPRNDRLVLTPALRVTDPEPRAQTPADAQETPPARREVTDLRSLVTDDDPIDVYGDGAARQRDDVWDDGADAARRDEDAPIETGGFDDDVEDDLDDDRYDEDAQPVRLRGFEASDPSDDYSADPYNFDDEDDEDGESEHLILRHAETDPRDDAAPRVRLSEDMARVVEDFMEVDVPDPHADQEDDFEWDARDEDLFAAEEDEVAQQSVAEKPETAAVPDPEPQAEALKDDRPTPEPTASLSAKIEALEAAIGNIADTWEPDGVGEGDYAGTEPEAMEWEDNDPEPERGPAPRLHFAPLKSAAAEEAEAPKPRRPHPYVRTPEDSRQDDSAERPRRAADAAPQSGGLDLPEDELLDEEALRDLVAEIVRAELQGALGERITRNVRKLVRREIHRALTAQELE